MCKSVVFVSDTCVFDAQTNTSSPTTRKVKNKLKHFRGRYSGDSYDRSGDGCRSGSGGGGGGGGGDVMVSGGCVGGGGGGVMVSGGCVGGGGGGVMVSGGCVGGGGNGGSGGGQWWLW